MAIEVVLAETAWHDLDEIYDWVADRSDPDTAQKYVGRILRLCGSLGEFPKRGAPRDDLAQGIRTIAFERRATIAYQVRRNTVLVLHVFHHGRDHRRAFSP
ncbi:MAG TPA: type II toxin-antitoxin system RelE/ParE family toxin [Sphingomicrobium sp.]